MKCTNCSNEQASGKFCGKCGTPLQVTDQTKIEEVTVPQSLTETTATITNESVAEPTPNPAPPIQPNAEGTSFIQEFLHFDKMITPSIIKIIFWIGSGLTILFGLFLMISGAASDYGGGAQVFLGLLSILIGPFVIRIYCELLILFFKIHETLQDMSKVSSGTRF